jgi:hypothetical protein
MSARRAVAIAPRDPAAAQHVADDDMTRHASFLMALVALAALAAAATGARALEIPTYPCGAVAAGGRHGDAALQTFGHRDCAVARRVATTWLRTRRMRFGAWRCARSTHQRAARVDEIAYCRWRPRHSVYVFVKARRRSCGALFRGPELPVHVQAWGVAPTRCATARRLVAAFLRRPRAHRAGWTCHVPRLVMGTPPGRDYDVGCHHGRDAGVYGYET